MKIYEGEHHRRSIVSYPPDCHAARALKLRKSLPRLEMPCVRAATSSIGVRLDRLRVPRPIRRKIFALAFDLPDEEERLAEKRRDEELLRSSVPFSVFRPAAARLPRRDGGSDGDSEIGCCRRPGGEFLDA